MKIQSKNESYAILDILLFNYTIGENKLFDLADDGKRNNIKFKDKIECLQNNGSNDLYKFDHKIFAELLKKSISKKLDDNKKNILTVTAGFDSRAILAAFNNLAISYESLTFGQEDSIEQNIAETFINDYSNSHHFIELGDHYLQSLDTIIDSYLRKNLECPTILDLLHYQFIFDNIEEGNFLMGSMAGELIMGQSVGAQVTFTEFASKVLLSANYEELKEHFKSEISKFEFLDLKYISLIEEDYLQLLMKYVDGNTNKNILQFLLNEKFMKFFGAIEKVAHDKINVVTPFVDEELITYLINSDISFFLRKPFANNPISNFNTKRQYAKAIKYLDPSLGYTKFDRLYSLDDIALATGLPKVFWGYFKSHVIKTNKKPDLRPHHYDLWLKNFVIRQVNSNKLNTISPVFKEEFSLDSKSFENTLPVGKKRLINLAAIIRSFNLSKNYV